MDQCTIFKILRFRTSRGTSTNFRKEVKFITRGRGTRSNANIDFSTRRTVHDLPLPRIKCNP